MGSRDCPHFFSCTRTEMVLSKSSLFAAFDPPEQQAIGRDPSMTVTNAEQRIPTLVAPEHQGGTPGEEEGLRFFQGLLVALGFSGAFWAVAAFILWRYI
jgi:hypothetical protein